MAFFKVVPLFKLSVPLLFIIATSAATLFPSKVIVLKVRVPFWAANRLLVKELPLVTVLALLVGHVLPLFVQLVSVIFLSLAKLTVLVSVILSIT